MQQKRQDLRTILDAVRSRDWMRLLPPSQVLVAGLVAMAGALAWWYFAGPATGTIVYATRPATQGDVIVKVRATGTIEPIDQVEISSELSGTVRSVLVDFNDHVKAGQVLAELDTDTLTAQLASARAVLTSRLARVSELRATVRENEAAFRRAKQLRDRSFLSQQGLDQAQAARERAVASLGSALADVETAKADLKVKEANLGRARIRSPIAGIVLDRNVEPGQTVASSLQAPVLFRLAHDLSRMQLEVDIDEADVAQVSAGNPAGFTVEGFQGQVFPAQITSVHYASETVEGVVTYKAVLSIDNTSLRLRPGMTATADIRVREVRGAVLIPNAALRYTPPDAAPDDDGRSWLQRLMPGPPHRPRAGKVGAAGRSVWVMEQGVPVERAVSTGATDGLNTQLVSGGIKPGDALVVDAETGSE